MALIKSGTIGNDTPLLAYQLYAEQTGASGTKRTVKITAYFKVNGSSSSWYGYACNWRARVHGSYGSWSAIKGTESWNGGQSYRSFSQTLTVDVGTTNSVSIVVGLYTDSQIDNSWDGSATGNFTVSSTNTPPTLSGTVATSPSGTIPENTKSITVTSPVASDANGNLSQYRCRVSINGGGYSEVYRGASRAFNHDISNYGEGTTFQYCFDCFDTANAWSGNVYSAVVTKNKFTGDTLSSSSSIVFSTGNSTISFSFSGAKNTNGNTTFNRVLSCDGITIYNSKLTTSPATVTIYRTGTVPTTPYIKFDDIKNKFAGGLYKGTLTFKLTTTNAYGTPRTSSKAISVNLQTQPNPVGSCNIATNANSTAYKTVTSTNNKYFLPDGTSVVRVDWSAGSGKLGEAITYEVYVAYGSGAWIKLADVASGTHYYNHVIAKQTVSQSFKYKIRTKTKYGFYADRDTSAQTLHFYNPPNLTTGTITRGATTADVQVTVKSNSSIPNINTVGTWKVYVKDTTTVAGNSGTLTVSQAMQTLKVTGLTDAGQYDLKVTFRDNTGFSKDDTRTIVIGANSPIFFVNKYGVGVNGSKANANYSLNVKGNIGISGSLQKAGSSQTWLTGAQGNGAIINMTSQSSSGYNPIIRQKTTNGAWTQAVYTNDAFYLNYVKDSDISAGNNKVSGQFIFPANVIGTVYTTGNKPTTADIGAVKAVNKNGYFGMTYPDGTETNWFRTTTMGIIPYKSNDASGNGGSSLGTTSWRFKETWSTTYNGVKLNAGSSNMLSIQTAHGKVDIGANNTGHCHYMTDRPDHWFDKTVKVQGEIYAGGSYDKRVYHQGFKPSWGDIGGKPSIGNVPVDYTRISNLNARLTSGWYSWSSGTTGAPTSYGVLLCIQWTSNGDFYQLAIGSNNALYTRAYVNGAYTSWSTK